MSPNFKLQCHFILIFLTALRGESRYLELREAADYDPFLLFSANLKRELAGEQPYRRALRCLDMLSLQGQFTFTADRPQLHCAAFFISEPEEFITIHYDQVSIDCQGRRLPEGEAPTASQPGGRHGRVGKGWGAAPSAGLLSVFDGWILKGEKFPSPRIILLPSAERYIDFCESGLSRRSIRSSQNVAMIFFRVHEPGNGFTLTIKTDPNLFPCNVISQTPNGKFTLVVPHQHRNCSFSIIYLCCLLVS
ncbi:CRHBP isoform 4 [Pan troglodytes]|uniref:Corticotropin-releasing factor-binding protein n=1 Tax=Pan troglodytes TaxID=9598 RepID=A0A2J8IJM1_PANTR|nr:CRHBP isoform 4 [Pan troglodytes]